MCSATAARCFRAWFQHAVGTRTIRALVARISRGAAAHCFRAWRAYVADRLRHKARLSCLGWAARRRGKSW